jgi:hypothetical protein
MRGGHSDLLVPAGPAHLRHTALPSVPPTPTASRTPVLREIPSRQASEKAIMRPAVPGPGPGPGPGKGGPAILGGKRPCQCQLASLPGPQGALAAGQEQCAAGTVTRHSASSPQQQANRAPPRSSTQAANGAGNGELASTHHPKNENYSSYSGPE